MDLGYHAGMHIHAADGGIHNLPPMHAEKFYYSTAEEALKYARRHVNSRRLFIIDHATDRHLTIEELERRVLDAESDRSE